MLPPPYNDVLQIIQTPGYVLVVGNWHRAACDPDRREAALI